MTHELFYAIDDLTMPTSDGRRMFDSLWEQLHSSIATRSGIGGRGTSAQPPLATSVVSLIDEVERDLAHYLRASGGSTSYVPVFGKARGCRCRPPWPVCAPFDPTVPPVIGNRRDVPAELRAIGQVVSKVSDDAAAWLDRVQRWVNRARLLLDPPDGLSVLRGYRCPACDADTVTVPQDGEWQRQPALALAWEQRPDDQWLRARRSAVQPRVQITCRACGHSTGDPRSVHPVAAAT